jgi:hypothetical protein
MLSNILLFILLTPGMLLTIPPGPRGIFFSGETSLDAILTAALVFTGILYYKQKIPILRDILRVADALF